MTVQPTTLSLFQTKGRKELVTIWLQMLLAIDLECQDIKIYSNIYTFFPINTSLQSIYSFCFCQVRIYICAHIYDCFVYVYV